MTDTERLLWSKIRGKQMAGYQFYRQKIIGDYIVDFYCPRRKVVVELDGGQHYTMNGKEEDSKRDNHKVLRFSDREVLENISGVMESIWTHCNPKSPLTPLC